MFKHVTHYSVHFSNGTGKLSVKYYKTSHFAVEFARKQGFACVFAPTQPQYVVFENGTVTGIN